MLCATLLTAVAACAACVFPRVILYFGVAFEQAPGREMNVAVVSVAEAASTSLLSV